MTKASSIFVLLSTAVSVSAATPAGNIAFAPAVEDWPCWRGPRLDGSSLEAGVPVKWSATENVAWKVEIPGKGHSSPVVVGDRLFVTTCIENSGKRVLYCFDRRDGSKLWEREVLTARLEGKHALNSFASSTPATDGKHVWVTFLDHPKLVVACYDVDGAPVWSKSPGMFFSQHGFCSSPILYKDFVIVNADQDPPNKKTAVAGSGFKGEAYIVALDKLTGEQRWRIPRENITRSYCVPLIAQVAGKTQMILTGSKCVAGYDPDTGKRLWIVDGPTEQFVSSPVLTTDGVLFLTYGFPRRGIMAIRPDGEGNVTKTHVMWNIEKQSRGGYVPSPLAMGTDAFLVVDEGMASCVEAKTGALRWQERLGRHHSASGVSAGGNVYFTDDDGNTFVVKAAGKFDLVSKNPLGEECYASPAISHGRIYIRTLHHLWCIGNK